MKTKSYFAYNESIQCVADVQALKVTIRGGEILIDLGRHGMLNIPCYDDDWRDAAVIELAKQLEALAAKAKEDFMDRFKKRFSQT